MIKSVQFKNFKVLRNTTLPLGPFTLIVGPNGSGKSTALEALGTSGNVSKFTFARHATLGLNGSAGTILEAELKLEWGSPIDGLVTTIGIPANRAAYSTHRKRNQGNARPEEMQLAENFLSRIRLFSLNPKKIATPASVQPGEIMSDGSNLTAVLDWVRDDSSDRFQAINSVLARWLPEYDQISFASVGEGKKLIKLRTREGRHWISASELSDGTLLALALLTLAYLPAPPTLIGLEEPDRGVHPRLLRDIRDTLYRLSYPADFGEEREPVQVVATSHSPYFLDLFRDHADEVVIAHKAGNDARFTRLSDVPSFVEIIGAAPLGEVWFSGILGGVPSEP